ncbi:MAG: DUF3095 family protein, partial [Nitrospirota bacterium]|nr:DUF3095 family protein [Nitrospirota bacterium]
MTPGSFYSNLRSFSEFRELAHDRHFSPIPHDWFIVVTDVKESTKAICDGRYKDVNTLGAASIATTYKAMEGVDFPYDFAGDGATLAVPPHRITAVLDALAALKALAQAQFNLDLRVGRVLVSELIGEGVRVDVAKFELASGKCIAIFQGGGLVLAEKKVKHEPAAYEVKASTQKDATLDNLSCRWNAIPNRHGRVLSLLVLVRFGRSKKVYHDVLEELDRILDGGLDQANPVNVPSMTYKSFSECVADERRYHWSWISFAFLARLLEIFLAVLIFKFKVDPLVMDPAHYKNAMRIHSDYRKFADVLRVVIDCSQKNVDDIRAYLATLYEKGELYYGLHES